MSADEEMFEQTRHVSDGFGGQRYEASGTGPSRQSVGQAEAERLGPMAMLQFGQDLSEVARHGSAQARRRLRIFRAIFLGMVLVPVALQIVQTVLS